MNKLKLITLSLVASVGLFAQTAPTSTTLTNKLDYRGVATTPNNQIAVGSTTGIYPPGLNPQAGSGLGDPLQNNITYLLIDRELLRVNGVYSTTNTVAIERGVQGTKAAAHNAAATVWIMYPNMLLNSDPTGACVRTNIAYLPQYSFTTGLWFDCLASGPNANTWQISNNQNYQNFSDGYFFVPPTACTFFPTTVTQTTTYPALGASDVFVVNSTTSSAAGTTTISCNITVPTRLTANKGAYITGITVPYGLQTSAATSINGASLATITLPTAVATETPSTVTPVAIAGSLTQSSTTSNLATTTAGSFYTSKITLATPWHTSDNTVLVFQLAFNNTASSVLTVNSPGLIVYYNLDPQ